MSYLVISLKVSKVSMLQSLSFISPSVVMPSVMTMYALDLKMAGRLGVSGVGIVSKDCRPWTESMSGPNGYREEHFIQRRGACLFDSSPHPQGNPMLPLPLADIVIALLVRCRNQVEDGYEAERFLSTMRLAGGVITSSHVRVFDDETAAFSALGGGFLVQDVTRQLAGSSDPAGDLLKATCTESWVLPANLGYALLEAPLLRSGARDGHQHAFCEDMIGLVKYVSLSSFRSGTSEVSLPPLWRHGWHADQFLVTDDPEVHLESAPHFTALPNA